ncbi:GIY-YIG nuclease family protein [Flavobacterium sp.]|uniref:GIY-YIG nuclease family protein n=1 Tax=Flavobacterium sp. TaxID=239 RepID=UPI0039E28C42
MHYLYILYSISADKFYVGETYNVSERIAKHNEHQYANSFTKIANDWKLVLSFECQNEQEANYLEKFIKRMKSKTFIQKIIDKPEILTDILSQR